MLATYHNHTTFSDGRATVAETVEAARQLGIGELGFSDHFVIHADRRAPRWAMARERLPEYVATIQETAGRHDNIEIRLGLEIDWFSGQAGAIARAIENVPVDYVIGSVHDCHGFPVDASAEPWKRLDEVGVNDIHRSYWRLVEEMAGTDLFDMVAHIDLAKKFGHLPTVSLDEEVDAALDAIARGGQVVEINTAGWHKPCADAYPTLDILERCHRREIPVTLSSDSHRPNHLVRDFRAAAERLAAAGYEQVARFHRREIRFERLEDAVRGLDHQPCDTSPDGW